MTEDENTEPKPPHAELVAKFSLSPEELVAKLLTDPLLADVPPNPTVDDIDRLIAIETGAAMPLWVQRYDGELISVTVNQNATVLDLKKAFQRVISAREEKFMGSRRISWRYFWRQECLMFEGQRLLENGRRLTDFGIHSKATLLFGRHRLKRREKRMLDRVA